MITTDAVSDVDAIRHVNHFGTPQVPLMNITCVPGKAELVRCFLQARKIPLWPNDMNPLMENSVDAADKSPDATKYRVAHFTRVMIAWWKAANFVQITDTALYYQCLVHSVF